MSDDYSIVVFGDGAVSIVTTLHLPRIRVPGLFTENFSCIAHFTQLVLLLNFFQLHSSTISRCHNLYMFGDSRKEPGMYFVVVFFICLLLSVNPHASDRLSIVRDSLKGYSPDSGWKIWNPVMGSDYMNVLEFTDQGFRLKDINGDMYKDYNSQRAVFIRKPIKPQNYYFQCRVNGFVPQDQYAQVGLIAWNDQDNYVRNTVGFLSPAMEGLGEFNGNVHSEGLYYLFPVKHPLSVYLRIDVLTHSIRTYASFDGEYWLTRGGFTLPAGQNSADFIQGAGIMGVGGEMLAPPLFTDWEEGRLASYNDDEFTSPATSPVWMRGQTNAGWGSDECDLFQHDGCLVIKPYSKSDIYFGYENYPFCAMPAPASKTWELEAKVVSFKGVAEGQYNKAGVVLWQDNRHFITLSIVTDARGDRMYFEALSYGDKGHFFGATHIEGFQPRTVTDLFFRLGRLSADTYRLRASYDGKTWFELGTWRNRVPEPQVRLFATRDVFGQYPGKSDYSVSFDYIKQLTPPGNEQ